MYKAQLQVKESRKAKIAANRALALILNMPLDDVDKIDVFDPVGKLQDTSRSQGRTGQEGRRQPA